MLVTRTAQQPDSYYHERAGGTAFVFPGEGAQLNHADYALFDAVPEFAASEAGIDELLGYSVRQLCRYDPENRLRYTQYVQPTLYILNALHYYKARRSGDEPAFVAGHSLGEYNALLAAGVFDLMTGLRLVKYRSELMATAAPGSMAAVVGLEPLSVAQLVRGQHPLLDVASYDSPSQAAIAGPRSAVRRARPDFNRAGAQLYVPLQVELPFHSRYMGKVAELFAEHLRSYRLAPPSLPVISNVTASPYPEDSAEGIKSLLEQQITHPVDWVGTVRYLMHAGATVLKEVGPGDTLARLMRRFHH